MSKNEINRDMNGGKVMTRNITVQDFENILRGPEKYIDSLGFDTKNILDFSISIKGFKPIESGLELLLKDCRTYWVAEKEDDGKIKGYKEETICYSFQVVGQKPHPP